MYIHIYAYAILKNNMAKVCNKSSLLYVSEELR